MMMITLLMMMTTMNHDGLFRARGKVAVRNACIFSCLKGERCKKKEQKSWLDLGLDLDCASLFSYNDLV